ncbi:hypothetical protein F0562_007820 [Nyssa sinensis]|uniref:Zinc finger PHD-type domain-containing protein n=1 Tax=Nyssa sinensis TaxID=561372 RepID=A0A5J5A6H7_9ASTE|nr:hypothetical protein F0562_007820 [Nyssa sinensis]
MRNRTHRLPTSDPPDDWVDGSWTVDCICGVNFDDGEEMVNCDECGVWVHTRCSRYVKSEKSFACDKCKSKNSKNDSEETEVAQLLVELPTKTPRMDNPYPSNCPPRQPFRLWTDIPIEERVHVQGIPGGDPAIFGGLEFPCWDGKQELDARIKEDHENSIDKGAGVLFSLSKENVLPTPVATLVGMKRQVEEGVVVRLAPLKDVKKGGGEDLGIRCPQNGVKKERSLLHPFVIHSGKRKKEDLGSSKDRSGKKKARVVDKEGDSRNRVARGSRTASTLSSDAKQLEFYEDRGPEVLRIDTPGIKNGNLRDTEAEDPLSDEIIFHVGARPREDKAGHQVSARIESSPKTVDGVASFSEHTDFGSISVKKEVVGVALDNADDNDGCSSRSVGIDSHKSQPLVEDMSTAAPKAKDDQNLQDSNGDMSPSSLRPNLNATKPLFQHPGMSADNLSENVKLNNGTVTSLQSSDHKVQGGDSSIAALSDCQTDKADELPGNPCQLKQQLEGSIGSMASQKCSSEPKHGSRPAEEPSKSGGSILSTAAPFSQHKMIVSVGKSSSTSSTIVIPRPSISDNQSPANAQNHNSIAKQCGMSDGNVSIKKDNASTDCTEGRRWVRNAK